MSAMRDYRAPWWLPGGHLQTIWPALFSRPHFARSPGYARERWRAPDGDFIDVDHLPAAAGAPWLVLFHGLESSSTSRYAVAFAQAARARGWHFVVPHFRGCSGELNLAPRSYHSGDFAEIGWVLGRIRAAADAPVLAARASLGGNALLRLGQGAGNTYARMFLRTMRPPALAKWGQSPGLFDRERLVAARTLRDFDDCFTAPLHGFDGAEDYWRRASAKPHLDAIRVPALMLNARNDPIVPDASLPRAHEVGSHLTLWQPHDGGHVGFVAGRWPGHVHAMPDAVCDWLAQAGLVEQQQTPTSP